MTFDLTNLTPTQSALLGGAVYLGLVNLWTFMLFALDKRRARAGEWRIPERMLLLFAAAGGWPAAKVAQVVVRHKTRKQPFGVMLNLSLIVPLAVGGYLALQVWPGLANALSIDALRETAAALVPASGGPEERPNLPRRFGPGSEQN